MKSDQQKDERLITAPIKHLYDQVLAPERHDLFLSALAVVHRKQRLTIEVAEQTAFLMMQTGDGNDNFHGWVRLAMWSRFNGCSVCRQVLAALESVEAVKDL